MLRIEIDTINEEAKAPKTPKGFGSLGEFMEHARERYSEGYAYNQHNMLAGKDDAKFVVGNQWDPEVFQSRVAGRKPTLTFNHLVAFMAQVVGNRLANETEIRVYPEKSGTKAIASLREGLIKSIFKNSHADFARDEAAKYQVIGGEGYFTLAVEYVADDVFEQEIKLNPVADPYAVVLDPLSIEPSGGDALWGFVGEDIPRDQYKARWPKAAIADFERESHWNRDGLWATGDTVRIAQYWEMVTEGTRTLALYQDGTVKDISGMEEWEWAEFVTVRADGSPYTREVPNRFARRYLISGCSILEGPHDYPITSLPIYRVPGWEVNDGEQVHRWGLIRFLKDPSRMNNVIRSIMTEQAMNVPRNKYLTTPEAVQGHEDRWRKAAVTDDPFLMYNSDAQAPARIEPPGLDAGLYAMSSQLVQDVKDISNIHEASLGMPSNEVSKVAIQQRQMVSDVGTFIYVDRRRIADERCAKNINELIPYLYDTMRTVSVIGPDDKEVLAVLNDPSDPNSDVTLGKYAVKVSTGPSSETKRALALEQMMTVVNAMPDLAANMMDIVVEKMDWPGSHELSRRIRQLLPPGMIPADELTPEQQQQQAQAAQAAQAQQQIAEANMRAEIAEKEAKAANQEARAHLATAQAYKAQMDAESRRMDVESRHEDRVQKGERDDEKFFLDVVKEDNEVVAEDRDFLARTTAAARADVNPNGEQ